MCRLYYKHVINYTSSSLALVSHQLCSQNNTPNFGITFTIVMTIVMIVNMFIVHATGCNFILNNNAERQHRSHGYVNSNPSSSMGDSNCDLVTFSLTAIYLTTICCKHLLSAECLSADSSPSDCHFSVWHSVMYLAI
jgi:hypothetical protein